MKRHDNTLYVTTQGAYLAVEGTNVLVRVEKETRLRVPLHNLGGIVCFGNVGCSPFLMGACGKAGVSIAFHSVNGRFLARVLGPQTGNVLLRRAQHIKTTDTEATATFARSIISAKIANARAVLQRGARDHGEKVVCALIEASVRYLADLLRQMQASLPVDVARGKEGEAARSYFVAFGELIVQQKADFFFHERSRRPPLDNMNALMSFLYALLTTDVASGCESVGLDPQMGFLHGDRSGRASLALDLMEEFRPMICRPPGIVACQQAAGGRQGFYEDRDGGRRNG